MLGRVVKLAAAGAVAALAVRSWPDIKRYLETRKR
jgi:hypothetical protein